MKDQLVKIQLLEEPDTHTVYFGLLICHPTGSPRELVEMFLPVGRCTGEIEAVRTQLIESINDMFDAAQRKGKFSV